MEELIRNGETSKKRKNHKVGWSISDWDKAARESKLFESFKIYVIRCFNEEEEFYKVGRTFTSVKNRFKKDMPYEYEIIDTLEGSLFHIYKLENKIHRELKDNKYIPKIKFIGDTECFSNIDYYINNRKNKK